MFPTSCDPKHAWPLLLGAFAYTLLEYWLGKTNRVRANSTLELAALVLVSLVGLITSLKGKKDARSNEPTSGRD